MCREWPILWSRPIRSDRLSYSHVYVLTDQIFGLRGSRQGMQGQNLGYN